VIAGLSVGLVCTRLSVRPHDYTPIEKCSEDVSSRSGNSFSFSKKLFNSSQRGPTSSGTYRAVISLLQLPHKG
jgi:hypothetical protein